MMLLKSGEELGEKIDAAIDLCNDFGDSWNVYALQEQKDKSNAYLRELLKGSK